MRTKNCTALVTVAVVSLFLAFLSSTMAYAQAPAGPNRPAGVPEGYVITPSGYFHPSCVQHIKEGETLLGDARIRHADGTEDANVHFCNYPSYTAKGEVITEGSTKEKPPTISWSWIVSSEATTSTSYGEIVATWLVPPSPTSHDGQTVYLFPGLMDNADQVSIIQPVLGWGGDYATSWGIASWNCCPSGITTESSPVPVNAGDTILGTTKSTCSAGTETCTTWNITTEDVTLGKSTTLSNSPYEGQTMNWAFEGTLEVYSISQCSDYPPNGAITFYDVGLYDYNFNPISNPGWAITDYYAGLTPQCNYGGQASATQATLDYGTTLESQTITFTTNAPSSAVYNSQFTVAATASSGLTVTFTSSGGCTNSGATYTMTSGTTACSVIANQAGNATYAAAPTVTQTTTATLASQTISWTTAPPASAAYYGTFNVAATATSGLAVSIAGSGECSGSGSSGSATITMNATSGTCTVTASQSGSTNYSAATSLTPTVSATQASQTISFTTNPPASEVYNGQFTVAATASSTLAVAFTSSGSCSNSGATYTMTSGTGTCSVTANQAGNTYYAAATPVTKTTNATLASQTISFTTNPPSSEVYNGQFTVAATASSTLAVAFTSSGSCSNSGATYTMTSGTGTCSVIANQAGNTNYAAATPVTKTVNATLASQTITFTTNAPASAAYGQTFTVAATGGASGNAVVFTSGGSCSNSGATYTMTGGTGNCSVIANQAGNLNYAAATTVTETTSATLATSATVVTSSANPTVFGQPVTLTATISGQFGQVKGKAKPKVVTGSVTWSANTGCSASTVTSGTPGVATCTTSILPVGTDTITATYSGDSNHGGGAGTLSGGQVVNQASSATTVASTVDPSAYGQAVSFTANVTAVAPGTGTATGTVQFNIDGSAFGSPVTLASGSATSGSISTLTMGTHTVTAVYSGATGLVASTGTLSGGQVVGSATAGTVVTSNLNPSTFGQSVTFTATISGQYGLVKGQAKPKVVTGSVTWSTNTGCGTTMVTSGSPGVATCTTSILPVGTDAITATYSGDSNHGGSTGTLSGGQVVNQAGSATAVASSLDPSTYGQAVSFTANVTAGTGTPTGTVQFNIDGSAFGSPVTLVSGWATSGSISTLTMGTHTVTAVYSGDLNFPGNTGTLGGGQVVGSATAGTVVTSNLNSSTFGQSVTLTATISGQYGLVRGQAKPKDVTGNVTWSANTGCGTTTVTSGNPGVATCTTSILPVGTDAITATYSGDSNHGGSTGTLSGGQVVNQASSATTVASTVNPSAYGQAVSFTANIAAVAPGTGAATGTVQFNVDGSAFGSPVTLASGSATSGSISTLTVGTHTITAVYSGNTNLLGSTGTLSGGQVVGSATAGTVVTSDLNPSTFGQSVTFTATISGQYGMVRGQAKPKVVTGSVTWSANTGCGTTTVTSGSPGVATCTTSILPVGTDTITATYSGDSNHGGSTGTLSGGQVVNAPVSQTITFTTNAPSSAVYNTGFTVAATGGASGNPVVFTSAGVCSNVGATYTMNSGSGTCWVIANQAGNSSYSAAPQVTETVTAVPAPQTITCNPPPVAVVNSRFNMACSTTSGEPVLYSSSGDCTNVGATYTTGKTVGVCLATVSAPGNSDYAPPTPVIYAIQVVKAIAPTVSLTGAPTSAYYQSTFTMVAASNSSSIPTITAAPSTVCTINDNVVTMVNGTGTCTLTAKWAANAPYSAATATQKTTAEKVASGLTWATPAPITYGAKLSATQLDATADVAGKFVYSPAAGSKPKVPTPPATCDTLKVTFTPTQTADYTKQTATVCLTVNP